MHARPQFGDGAIPQATDLQPRAGGSTKEPAVALWLLLAAIALIQSYR